MPNNNKKFEFVTSIFSQYSIRPSSTKLRCFSPSVITYTSVFVADGRTVKFNVYKVLKGIIVCAELELCMI